MQITVLGSGSKGNAALLQHDESVLLLDSGFSFREITSRITRAGFSPKDIDGIVLTHYHSDHINSAAMLAKRFNIQVYCSEETFPYLHRKTRGFIKTIIFRSSFSIKQFTVTPIAVPHDATGTVALFFEADRYNFTLATDMGEVPPDLFPYLQRSQSLLLESNHDYEMLVNGPYPWPLKQRVSSSVGHLSNDQAFSAIKSFRGPDTGTIILGHLSEENNRPELVRKKTVEFLSENPASIQFYIASQNHMLSTVTW